jgi:hypothetical protein
MPPCVSYSYGVSEIGGPNGLTGRETLPTNVVSRTDELASLHAGVAAAIEGWEPIVNKARGHTEDLHLSTNWRRKSTVSPILGQVFQRVFHSYSQLSWLVTGAKPSIV